MSWYESPYFCSPTMDIIFNCIWYYQYFCINSIKHNIKHCILYLFDISVAYWCMFKFQVLVTVLSTRYSYLQNLLCVANCLIWLLVPSSSEVHVLFLYFSWHRMIFIVKAKLPRMINLSKEHVVSIHHCCIVAHVCVFNNQFLDSKARRYI